MKQLLYTFLALLGCFLPSCNGGGQEVPQLAVADTLMESHPAKAGILLETVDAAALKGENRAYYALLTTRWQHQSGYAIKSDSLIQEAVSYYRQADAQRYIQALLCRGYAQEDMGLHADALESYLKVLTSAAPSDYKTLAQANMSIANLYMRSHSHQGEDIERFKQAIACFRKVGDSVHVAQCLRDMGAQYRFINKDSSYSCLYQAAQVALAVNRKTIYYDCVERLARAHYVDSNYQKAKDLALISIKANVPYLPNDCHYDAAMAYAKLGQRDSALYYLSHARHSKTAGDSIASLIAHRDIALMGGDYRNAYTLNARAAQLNDSIDQRSRHLQLIKAEKAFNRRQQQDKEDAAASQRTTLWAIIALLAVALLGALLFMAMRRKQNQREQMELMERLQWEMGRNHDQLLRKLEGEAQLKEVLSSQIESLRSIIDLSYKYSNRPEKFLDQFRLKVENSRLPEGLWGNLRYFVDAKYNSVITRLSRQYTNLTDDELYIMGLLCCGFTYADIAVCMGYTNINYVNTKKSRIAKKMGIERPLSDWLADYINRQ